MNEEKNNQSSNEIAKIYDNTGIEVAPGIFTATTNNYEKLQVNGYGFTYEGVLLFVCMVDKASSVCERLTGLAIVGSDTLEDAVARSMDIIDTKGSGSIKVDVYDEMSKWYEHKQEREEQ